MTLRRNLKTPLLVENGISAVITMTQGTCVIYVPDMLHCVDVSAFTVPDPAPTQNSKHNQGHGLLRLAQLHSQLGWN